jgi:hypothetical protein
MSAADAGRRKIEPREAGLVAVNDTVIDPDGREYTVVGFEPFGSVVRLDLQPKGQCGNRPFMFKIDETIRVRRKT